METKKCKYCGVVKELSEFGKNKTMKDGHLNKCKSCDSDYKKKHSEKNREKLREISKKYYKKNRDRILEYRKKIL